MVFKNLAVCVFIIITESISSQVSNDSVIVNNQNSKFIDYAKLPESSKTHKKFRYYYYPNIQVYYDNLYKVYYANQKGVWVLKDELPLTYLGYSRFNRYRVALEGYFDEKPYEMFAVHRLRYPYVYKGRLPKG